MTTELESDLALLAQRLRASSVAVQSARGAGSGSGVIWSEDGTIVTNAHVAVTPEVQVEFADGRRIRGRVDRRDVERDLARVRVDATGLSAAAYRDPHDLRVGEVIAAFGNPLGVRDVLTGIVYGAHRGGRDRFVRADVKIAPGNSGGALADIAGRVVGINSMVAGGLVLAVPADAVQEFQGEATAPIRLGVRLARADIGGGRVGYAIVAIEPRSSAERAGLIVGDIIVTRNLPGSPPHPRSTLCAAGALSSSACNNRGAPATPPPERARAVVVRDLPDDGAVTAALAERFDGQPTIVTINDPDGETARALLRAGARGVIGRDAACRY